MIDDLTGSTPDLNSRWRYEIRVLGTLDDRWSDWFHGAELTIEHAGERLPITTITCSSMDQTLLRGVLNKIWDLNLCVLSVVQNVKPQDQIPPRIESGRP